VAVLEYTCCRGLGGVFGLSVNLHFFLVFLVSTLLFEVGLGGYLGFHPFFLRAFLSPLPVSVARISRLESRERVRDAAGTSYQPPNKLVYRRGTSPPREREREIWGDGGPRIEAVVLYLNLNGPW
jgi:hypothetical protein